MLQSDMYTKLLTKISKFNFHWNVDCWNVMNQLKSFLKLKLLIYFIFYDFANFCIFFANLRKICKVVKYKVYKKLVLKKSLQLIHDIWTVNISMKIELWDFCKLFCTNISFWHSTRFTFMCVTSFSQKSIKYFYYMISLQKFFFAFLDELHHFEKFQIFCKFAKKMQKFAKL